MSVVFAQEVRVDVGVDFIVLAQLVGNAGEVEIGVVVRIFAAQFIRPQMIHAAHFVFKAGFFLLIIFVAARSAIRSGT